MPFSYSGFFFQKKFPMYDKQLGRIAQFVKSKENRALNIVDVGANIGDTVLNIGDADNRYLLIEGEESFSSYISYNLKGFNYILKHTFCTDSNAESGGKAVAKANGTAKIVNGETGNLLQFDTIDNIVKEVKFKPDILKIDTDGFDFKVLRGSKSTINEYKPVVFFEWTLNSLISAGENPISIFSYLQENGYEKLILFDNFGEIICKVSSKDTDLLDGLIRYTSKKHICYYDICAIHKQSVVSVDELFEYLV